MQVTAHLIRVRNVVIQDFATSRRFLLGAFTLAGSFFFATLGHATTPTAQAPAISPAAGTYKAIVTVTLTSPTPKAYFYYTVDGSTPSTSSTWYAAPFKVSANATVKAITYAGGYNASGIVSATYVVVLPAPAPAITPATGTYTSAQTVAMTCSNTKAAIYYTTDGSTPSTSSPVYKTALKISANTKVSAMALATGTSSSTVSNSTLTIAYPAAAPVFSLASAVYNSQQTVSISDATSGAAIYYTTNGANPTTASTHYTGPITLGPASTTNFIAAAIAPGGSMSADTKAWYDIVTATGAPVPSPAAGTYNKIQSVVLSDTAKGAVIHYTLDGSYPTTSSAVYTTPITATLATRINAMAVATGYSNGPASTSIYEIVAPPPTITPQSGSIASSASVTMSDAVSGLSIYYTTDGSIPTTASLLYSSPLKAAPTATSTFFYRAIAVGSGYLASSPSVASFTVDVAAPVLAETTIGSVPTRAIPTNFLGLSMNSLQPGLAMGQASTGTNLIYRTLLKNLLAKTTAPMLLRVEADDTQLSDVQVDVEPLAELAQAVNVNYTLGVDMWNDNPALAAQQAAAWVHGIPNNLIQGIEIGNEPDDYQYQGARPTTYSFANYLTDLDNWQQQISATIGSGIGTMGPSFGQLAHWIPNTEVALVNGTMKLAIVNQHAYVGGETQDGDSPTGAAWPSDTLLTPSSAVTAPEGVEKYAASTHKMGKLFRMGEINSFWGGLSGISDTFSSSLWSVDIMFNYLANGVDGVNWNNEVNTTYVLFTFLSPVNTAGITTWSLKQVNPLYYGLLAFSQVAGPTAQMLPVSTTTSANVSVWATVDSASTAHVVILNKDEEAAGNVQITLPGYTTGTIRYMTAPNYLAHNGVSLGGQTFDGSPDGTIQGTLVTTTIVGKSGVFTVPNLPITSAAFVDFTK